MICANSVNAYAKDVVPITTSVNLLQSQILTHATFDVGNGTESYHAKIEKRLAEAKKAHYEPPPVKWTNFEFIVPVTILFAICIASITMNLVLCFGCLTRSGPRRDLELNGY